MATQRTNRLALALLALGSAAACSPEVETQRATSDGRPEGTGCEVSDVRIELRATALPPIGRTLPLPTKVAEGYVDGANGQPVRLGTGPDAPRAMHLTATRDVTITFLGELDTARIEAMSVMLWPKPVRKVQAQISAKRGADTWKSEVLDPIATNDAEGWQRFRLPLPAPAAEPGGVERIDLMLTGDVVGEIGVETPLLEWSVAPSWKTLLEAPLDRAQPIRFADGERDGFALIPGRVLRARAKLTGDGGAVFFAHGSVEPARGKPTLAYFALTVRHPDGRVGQSRVRLETRGKWFESSVPFEGKSGETVDIELEFNVEGNGALCAAVTTPEVIVK